MLQDHWHRTLLRAVAGAAIAAFLVSAQDTAALAGDDDDGTFSVMDKIMSTIGLKKPGEESDITYTERSPLVVPPSRDLPPPIQTTATPPDWPKDKDVKRRRDAKAKKKQPTKLYDFTEDARPLRPDELEQGRRVGQDEGRNAPNHGDSGLGDVRQEQAGGKKSIFNFDWFRKEEYATFTGEPPRADLTDPPPGYRTPSADQPYGIGPDKTPSKSKGIGERMETETGH